MCCMHYDESKRAGLNFTLASSIVIDVQAEEIMRKLEKEEEILSYDDPDKKVFHLCIVNLVIGTLYCSKSNFQVLLSLSNEISCNI